jgi:prepilin-type N-terminal cleavage/methylation domain-containing protein
VSGARVAVVEGARGFTLVEVLLALFLMGLTLMAAAPMFIHAMKETAAGADLGWVGALAVQRMELLRAIDFYGLTAGGGLSTNISGYSDTSDPDFTVRWQIVDNASPATLKTVSVRVIATRTAIGRQKETTLTTVRAR